MKNILLAIVSDSELEAKWLNTLSLLEHIGARKIMKAMGNGHPEPYILEHISDEARHAAMFKRMACTISKENGRPVAYLCHDEAIAYFQMLDKVVTEWVQQVTQKEEDSLASYLLVTTLIERRAMTLYPLYRSITKSEFIREGLQKIILEESAHKPELETRALALVQQYGLDDIEELEDIEDSLFKFFTRALQRLLAPKLGIHQASGGV